MPSDDILQDQDEYRLGEKMDNAIARLPIQEHLLIEQMEGVFPEQENDLQCFAHVLDIACGTGTWAVEVAHKNPHIEVVGLERYPQLVHYAAHLAESQGVENASFALLSDEQIRLPFPNGFFDLVNARFLFTLLRTEEWPEFVKECLRVIRPGGYLRLIEPEWGATSSPAFERFKELFLRGLKRTGHGLSLDEKHIGVAFILYSLLTRAGAIEISQRFSLHTYWTGPQCSNNPARWLEMVAQSVKPLLLNQGIITALDFERLIQTLSREVICKDFFEIGYVLSVCGRKPEHVCEGTIVANKPGQAHFRAQNKRL